jgi:N-acyl-phosphatidylethanolamine-hydrolysing phospholipase D
MTERDRGPIDREDPAHHERPALPARDGRPPDRERPAHHRAGGGFRNPWPEAAGDDALRKRFREVAWEWLTTSLPPDPGPGELPIAESEIAHPHSDGELRVTWVGHATFLVQLPGLNVLTDPVWSPRVSPVSFLGSKRLVAASPALDALPPIQAVLISHDHYDHLDVPTVRGLHARFGAALTWYTPLGYRDWFAKLGVGRVVERDWWQESGITGDAYRIVAAPARHWTRRTPRGTNRRLWCSWALLPTTPGGHRVYFAGDSGYGSFFREVGERCGPFDASMIPIGAYEPRWFMKSAHMNPEEAVRVYGDVGGTGAFIPSHWGTFRLTFEPPLEPPGLTRAAWKGAGLPLEDLRILRHGETTRVRRAG